MFWKVIGRNLFYPLAIFLVISLWLFATESGCKTSFWIIENIVPGELKIERVDGIWANRLILKNISYQNSTLKLSTKEVIFEPNMISLLNGLVYVPFVKLENASFIWKENSASPVFIENGVGQFQMTFNRQNLSIDIQELTGSLFEMSLHAHAKINIIDKNFQIPTGTVVLGENKMSIEKSAQIKNQFEWVVNLNSNKKAKASFNGYLVPEQAENCWSGKLNKANFTSETTGSWFLRAPSIIQFSSTHLTLKDITLQNNSKRLQIKGDFYYGKQGLNSNLHLASFFVPKQALTLKDLHLNISGKIENPLLLKGSGYSGEGRFQMDGTMQFNTEKKLSLHFSGKNLQIYNTRNIQVIGSPTLALNFNNNTLFVDGTLLIHKGNIKMQDQKNVGLLSKDIVIKDSNINKNEFKIIPNLYLVVENNLHFDGYGMIATIGGKLTINERSDGLLTGNGKLTIKEGKYRLQGATRYIHRGHLLFPPGTLLKDPILDILISQNRVQQQGNTTSTNIGIYVQGTLLHPIYHPYSNDNNLKSADILSRLGFGQSEASGDENQRQLFAQTAFLFSGTANPFVDFLKKNLKLEELNLESKPTTKTFYTPGGNDTVLVVGKSLSEKWYLQYLQSIIEPVSTIRLKYFLSRLFTVSADTGTEGVGGDLTFIMEKN
ncbi:MAG TPA: translocation/assembly module TamB domain-containing protein [Gammaproteobacteria bacterium]|nr:translocation/assembly module TamB domain-containing protein [Gammaproteobacteria bacterium]